MWASFQDEMLLIEAKLNMEVQHEYNGLCSKIKSPLWSDSSLMHSYRTIGSLNWSLNCLILNCTTQLHTLTACAISDPLDPNYTQQTIRWKGKKNNLKMISPLFHLIICNSFCLFPSYTFNYRGKFYTMLRLKSKLFYLSIKEWHMLYEFLVQVNVVEPENNLHSTSYKAPTPETLSINLK